MTAINTYRVGRVERLAAQLGSALVAWASEREHAMTDRDELRRRSDAEKARLDREHRALRRLLG